MSRLFFFLIFIVVAASFSAEDETIRIVRDKSDIYFKKYNRAKLELVFNQPKYAPGDTVRFGMNYFYANNLQRITGKQIVHICLFDQFGKKVLTQWASIINGSSSLDMVIPGDFPSGNYVLVAFTDWMKNFDKELFFKKQFLISGKYVINEAPPQDTIIFSPEGGLLISEIENNLAIRYRGKDREAKIIISEGGNELATFGLVRDSVNVFRFVPKANVKYYAQIINGLNKRFEFPQIKASGVAIQIDATLPVIKVKAECVNIPSTDNLFLAGFSNSKMVFCSRLNFEETKKASFDLPNSLSAGVTQLVIFDSKFNLIASRVIYLPGSGVKEVFVDKLQDVYSTRAEVNVDFKIKDGGMYLRPTFYSCQILNDSLFSDSSLSSMDYLTFQSDISNTFLLEGKRITQATINNYLITQTCPWFEWSKIIGNNATVLRKPQEYLNLTGEAMFAKTGKRVPDSTQLLFFLEKNLVGYETYANAAGKFSFPMWISISQRDRFFFTASLKGMDIDDIYINTFDPDSSIAFTAKPWEFDANSVDRYSIYSANKQAISKSFSFFSDKSVLKDSIDEPNKAIEEELNGADIVLNLNDYLMFPTMEEVVREILKGVEYRKINGRSVLRVYVTGKYTTYRMGPLFVIDGMVTRDPSFCLALKPSDVISMKVVKDSKKLFALGKLGANGVIIVKTKLHSKIVKEKHVIDYAGMLSNHPTSWSGYSDTRMPDFRSCLFWTAKSLSVKDSEHFIFKTSDDVGKFRIRISGRTEEGIPFYYDKPFEVKYSGN